MNLKRKRVGPNEVEAIYQFLKECGLDMKERLGFDHWIPPFPLEFLRIEAQNRKTYAVCNDEYFVATFTIGERVPSYYRTSPGLLEAWDASGEPALYVNRLAVLPKLQKRGIGIWCMREIERAAFDGGYKAIRLDAYEKNLSVVTWYEQQGYQVRGNFSLVRSSGASKVTCLEKMRKDFIT